MASRGLILAGLLLSLINTASAQIAKTPNQLLQEDQTCAQRGLPPHCITSGNVLGDIVQTLVGRTAASVTDFGAKCDGSTNDGIAFQNAAASRLTIYIPATGTPCQLDRTITWNKSVFGAPGATVQWKSDLGTGNAGFICNTNGPSGCSYVGQLALIGPGCTALGSCTNNLGQASAQMYGIQLGAAPSTAPQPDFNDLTIEGFYAGVVVNSQYGHQRFENILATNNYYGLYILESGKDIRNLNSDFTGNSFAGIACAGTALSDCLDSSNIIGTHLGFEPFCIYGEPSPQGTSVNGFMNQVVLIDTHCEAVGNAMIANRAYSNGNIDSVQIIHPGFSFNTGTYELTTSVTIPCTTTNTQSAVPCSSNPVTAGVLPGMKVSCANAGDVPYGTYVYSVTSTQVNWTQNAAGGHAGQNCTYQWNNDYTIDTGHGTVTGKLYVLQGISPIAPTSGGTATGTIVGSSGSGNFGSVFFDYDDPNHGPPETSTKLISSQDGNLEFFGTVRWAGADSQPFTVTIANGASTGSVTKPYQDFLLAPNLYTSASGALLCTPTTPPLGAASAVLAWGAAGSIVGANLTVTVTTSANVASQTKFSCRVTLDP